MFMKQLNRRALAMITLAFFSAIATGCASGGYKLTRQYAGFVNKQNILVRILLYIFTSIVFGITMLVDLVVFNTMDFWNGKVSKGNYNFEKDGKMFAVNHMITPEGRRKSHIVVSDGNHQVLQDVVLSETEKKDIEIFVDGKLTGRVSDISSIPVATIYSPTGKAIESIQVFSSVQWLASN